MDIEFFFRQLENQLAKLFGKKGDNLEKEYKEDIDRFIKGSRKKLERWTILLSEKKIDLEDYEWLIKSQKDVIELKGLYKAGVSKISLGHLKNRIIKTIIEVIINYDF